MEVHDIDSFLKYFDTIRERTLRVVRAVPDESWSGGTRKACSRSAIWRGISRQ
jgi:hypothetical protein